MKKELLLSDYAADFSESKFWAKVKNMVKYAGEKILYMALLLYYTLKSPDVPTQQKLIIISALGYLICPIDLIPDAIPVVGYTDDLTALTTAIDVVKSNITQNIEHQAQAKVNLMLK